MKTDSFFHAWNRPFQSEDCRFLLKLTRIWEEACLYLAVRFFVFHPWNRWIQSTKMNLFLQEFERQPVYTLKTDSFLFHHVVKKDGCINSGLCCAVKRGLKPQILDAETHSEQCATAMWWTMEHVQREEKIILQDNNSEPQPGRTAN